MGIAEPVATSAAPGTGHASRTEAVTGVNPGEGDIEDLGDVPAAVSISEVLSIEMPREQYPKGEFL